MFLSSDFIQERALEILAAEKHQKKVTNPYGYTPTLWVCALLLALFSLSTSVHLGQALRTRKWYLIPSVVLGGMGEVIGWAGRLWSSKNVLNRTPFLIQISTTIISPTFIAAANFIILGTIIREAGEEYSRLRPSLYALIFVTIDIAALVVQAIGGGMASAAVDAVNGNPEQGGHVMLVGIIIQLVEIAVYVALAAEFFYNYSKGKVVRPRAIQEKSSPHSSRGISPDPASSEYTESKEGRLGSPEETGRGLSKNLKMMSGALAFSTLCLFIRAIYRTIELSNGWEGHVIHTQRYFNILDGAMIVLAMYTINFFHPGFLLR